MNDKFSKLILVGIFICLLIIALKPNSSSSVQVSPNPNINISSGKEVIQLAPNRIAVVNNKSNYGRGGTILVFDFDSDTKSFNLVGTFNYDDYFSNPQKYGIELN